MCWWASNRAGRSCHLAAGSVGGERHMYMHTNRLKLGGTRIDTSRSKLEGANVIMHLMQCIYIMEAKRISNDTCTCIITTYMYMYMYT